MAEITRRRAGEMMRAVFAVLLPVEEMAAAEVLRAVAKAMTLTDFERSEYPNRPGQRRFEKIVRFSTVALVKAGWIVKNKGRWALTAEGRAAYEKWSDPEEFFREGVILYKQWKKSQPEPTEELEVDAGDAPAPVATLEEAQEAAWTEIEKHLATMNPYALQSLVAGLLRAMGYHIAWVAPPGADKGIDVIAYNDPLGAQPPRIKVQVKRRADKVGAGELRSFMAVLGEQDVGIYFALAGFSSEAAIEARTQEKRKLTLVDADRLVELWIENYNRLREEDRSLLPLTPVHYLAPQGQ